MAKDLWMNKQKGQRSKGQSKQGMNYNEMESNNN